MSTTDGATLTNSTIATESATSQAFNPSIPAPTTTLSVQDAIILDTTTNTVPPTLPSISHSSSSVSAATVALSTSSSAFNVTANLINASADSPSSFLEIGSSGISALFAMLIMLSVLSFVVRQTKMLQKVVEPVREPLLEEGRARDSEIDEAEWDEMRQH